MGFIKTGSGSPTAQVVHAGIKPAEPPTVKSKAVELHAGDNTKRGDRVNFGVGNLVPKSAGSRFWRVPGGAAKLFWFDAVSGCWSGVCMVIDVVGNVSGGEWRRG